MTTKRVVIFGAGKMAGGLIGHVASQSGCTVQFVARRQEIIDAINQHGGYELRIADQPRRVFVKGCSALDIRDRQQVRRAVAEADIVFTALGIDNLASVVDLIGEGLFLRCQLRILEPLNVIACENLPGTGAYLRHQVLSSAPAETALCIERTAGFSAAVTRRVMTGGNLQNGVLSFSVDSQHELVIERSGLRGELPILEGATVTEEFNAVVLRKFFTLNCAQTVAAYLGYQAGCTYIHEAMAHPLVGALVRAALAEAAAALKAELPHHAEAIDRDAAETLERLGSSATPDTITRVAREPRRKLSPRERLVGPARLAQRHGLANNALVQAIAAALAYDAATDSQAVALQHTIASESLDKVLTEDCGLLPHEDLARSVKQQWRLVVTRRTQLKQPAARTGTRLHRAIHSMVSELSRKYEPRLVRAALASVALEVVA
jgi:mannitol-1-phosphate 5-dehydrogenase